MKISCEWLTSYLPSLSAAPEELAERLLLAGFPVEAIDAFGDDRVLDVEVTSNRPDLLGHLGVARELSALTGAVFAPPQICPAGPADDELANRTGVTLQTPDCPHYTARIIENVTVGPSPVWLTRRLEAVGLRPINNVVDATNYVLFEFSQPLHAFDYDKLAGPGDEPARPIIVRRAHPGEKMISIDGHLRELDESMMVIADAARPVAVAGVMGGLDTEVGTNTRTVLLESAYFDPMSVRATARKLGLFSDSSFRFERGVDPGGVEQASNRAADLIVELCGGRALPGLAVDPRGASGWAERLAAAVRATMRLDRMRRLLEIDVPADRVVAILAALGLSPRVDNERGAVTVTVPSFRQDIRREVDLIEEVARVEGYERIAVRDCIEVAVRPPDFRQATLRRIAAALCGLGFFETVGLSFVTGARAELFARPAGATGRLEVTHSSRRQENALRRSLLPSLLAARRHNQTVQVRRADLFEIAAVFDPPAGAAALPDEPLRLGLCTDGDLRYGRGVLEALVRALDPQAELTLRPADRTELVPGLAADVMLNGRMIGLIGRPTDAVRGRFDLGVEVTVAEVDVEPLLELAARPRTFTPIARYPAVERDVSVLVDAATSWQQIVEAVRGTPAAAPPQLEAVDFLDMFHGRQLPPGTKSITLTLRYRSPESTLTSEQANGFVAAAVAALSEKLGAVLRDK